MVRGLVSHLTEQDVSNNDYHCWSCKLRWVAAYLIFNRVFQIRADILKCGIMVKDIRLIRHRETGEMTVIEMIAPAFMKWGRSGCDTIKNSDRCLSRFRLRRVSFSSGCDEMDGNETRNIGFARRIPCEPDLQYSKSPFQRKISRCPKWLVLYEGKMLSKFGSQYIDLQSRLSNSITPVILIVPRSQF